MSFIQQTNKRQWTKSKEGSASHNIVQFVEKNLEKITVDSTVSSTSSNSNKLVKKRLEFWLTTEFDSSGYKISVFLKGNENEDYIFKPFLK